MNSGFSPLWKKPRYRSCRNGISYRRKSSCCEHAKDDRDHPRHAQLMLRGLQARARPKGAMAMAAAFHLPHRFYTCSAGTEVFDLIGQILPKMEKKGQSRYVPNLHGYPDGSASAYYMLTEQYDETIDVMPIR